MNKKQVAAIATVAAVSVGALGGSMAYLNDLDNADNTFTAGSVAIDLNEQQRNDDGTALEDFEQNKVLIPIVGSAQGAKDDFGMPTAKNYVDKIANVTNNGTADAYVRFYFALPAALDDGYETFNAGMNILHFNFGNKSDGNGGWTTTYGTDWTWVKNGKWNYFETTIDGVAYNVYYADYNQKLAPNATTSDAIQGLYLDSHVNVLEDGSMVYEPNGATGADQDLGFNVNNGITCPVFAIAAQADGFDDAATAFSTVYGTNDNCKTSSGQVEAVFNPWAE